jgi:5-methylcytosine-specific restriction endonuclease McrA
MIDLEFIKRAEEMAKPHVNEYLEKRRQKIDKWNNENREKLREYQRTYERSDKGIRSCRKRALTRYYKFKKACEGLTKQEIKEIREFYMNCPDGYEVDHIIPIAKGGKHRISNLQYLTPLENARKKDKIYVDNDNNEKR